MKGGRLINKKYFDIISFIASGKNSLKGNDVYTIIADTLNKIIKQYGKNSNTKLSLTLTAGLDSRIILSSLKEIKSVEYDTFTFGKAESYDVKFAKLIAKRERIPHKHFFPDADFFNYFSNYAKKT